MGQTGKRTSALVSLVEVYLNDLTGVCVMKDLLFLRRGAKAATAGWVNLKGVCVV